MEFKALKEYKNPECPTVEENKNRILMMMVRSGKISLGVAVMCLLCNYSWASDNFFAPTEELGGSVIVEPPFYWGVYFLIRNLCLCGIFIDLIVTLILGVENRRKYKVCEDVEEKERLRKRKNKDIIVGFCILLLLVAVIIATTIIIEEYNRIYYPYNWG